MTPSPTAPNQMISFFRSRGWRFVVLIGLVLAMFIPLIMISFVIEDRTAYQRSAVHEVSQQWGGPISIAGPVLVLPVRKEMTRIIKNEDGSERSETYQVMSDPVVLMPETLNIATAPASQIRHRGIFEIPVFTAEMTIDFSFDTKRTEGSVGPRETILWDRARVTVAMPRTRSFSGKAVLTSGAQTYDLEPGSALANYGGIQARLGDPRRLQAFSLTMGLNGADQLMFSPLGRQTIVSMTSDWPHPSFGGDFLPTERTVSAEGFTALWEIPHLAREIPQVSRGADLHSASFGVRFYNPIDFYQKVQRAAKYGILFIALTFLTVFLMERFAARTVHPAQFVLIGVAQCIFFLLLLSMAEQIGFTLSYLLAGGATIGLISFYARTGLGLGQRAWTLAGALVALYGTLYMILRSADYALLAGSVLAFIAVAIIMVMTRSDNWSADGAPTR